MIDIFNTLIRKLKITTLKNEQDVHTTRLSETQKVVLATKTLGPHNESTNSLSKSASSEIRTKKRKLTYSNITNAVLGIKAE
jgi:hypothetical protein